MHLTTMSASNHATDSRLEWFPFPPLQKETNNNNNDDQAAIQPEARSFHSCTYYHDSIIIFGGVSDNTDRTRYLNDVWIRSKTTNVWRNDLVTFSGSRNVPSPRCRHSAIALEKGLYVFGGSAGFGEENGDNDIYLLEHSSQNKFRWIKLVILGEAPCARFGHCACRVTDTSFLIFGGRSVATGADLNDMYLFDAVRLLWSKVDISADILPSPGTDYAMFPLRESKTSVLLIGARPWEFDGESYGPAENFAGFIISYSDVRKNWMCSRVMFEGFRGNSCKQTTSETFSQRIGLGDVVVVFDRESNLSSWRTSPPPNTVTESFSSSMSGLFSMPSQEVVSRTTTEVLFPGDRWFPTFFAWENDIYCIGGIAKKSGRRSCVDYAWRFRMDDVVSHKRIHWELVRLEKGSQVATSRVGWSACTIPLSMTLSKSHLDIGADVGGLQNTSSLNQQVLFVFGGTEVGNSYLDDVIQVDKWQEDDQLSNQKFPERITRKIVASPVCLIPRNLVTSVQIEVAQFRPFDSSKYPQSRIGFVTSNLAVHFTIDGPLIELMQPISAVGNKRPNDLNSLYSFQAFENNVIWAVSWDLSLYMFAPTFTVRRKEQELAPKTEATTDDNKVALALTNGSWQRVVKPLIPPSPSTGANLEFLGAELSVLWPDDHREGFAVTRFTPNEFYTVNRKFADPNERAFEGDVLVLMGGMRTHKERSKAAKLLGVGERARPGAKHDSNTVSYLNDIWIAYSTYSSRRNSFTAPTASLCSWKKLWPPSEIAGGPIKSPALLEGRARHSLTALPSLGILVAFGGLTDLGGSPTAPLVLIDLTLRSKDFTTAHLIEPNCSGSFPPPRFNHAATATGHEETSRLVICGGQSSEDSDIFFKDIFVWDVTTGVWNQVMTEAPLKSLGWLHYCNDRFYYFFSEDYSENDEQNFLTWTQ